MAFNYDEYLDRTLGVESSGDYTARNKRSTAFGGYQITDPTWDGILKNNPDADLPAFSEAATPEQQREAARLLTEEQVNAFNKQAGRVPSQAEAYQLHHFGTGRGTDLVLNADPNVTFDQWANEQELKANPHLKGKNIGEWKADIEQKYSSPYSQRKAEAKAEVSPAGDSASGEMPALRTEDAPGQPAPQSVAQARASNPQARGMGVQDGGVGIVDKVGGWMQDAYNWATDSDDPRKAQKARERELQEGIMREVPTDPNVPLPQRKPEVPETNAEVPALQNTDVPYDAENKTSGRIGPEPTVPETSKALVEEGVLKDPEKREALENQAVGEDAPEEEKKGFWSRLLAGELDTKEQEALLRFGSGMLAGKNFSEGMALGGQGVADVMQDHRQDAAASGGGYDRPFDIAYRDKESGKLRVTPGYYVDNEYYVRNDKGEMVPAHTVGTDVNIASKGEASSIQTGAGGIPNADGVYELDGTQMPVFTGFQRESEAKNYGYAIRGVGAEAEMSELVNTGYNPSSVISKMAQYAASEGGIKAAAANNLFSDPEDQRYASAAFRYLQGILRRDTGAAYTDAEIRNYMSAFVPSPGESPEAQEAKRRARLLELTSSAQASGKAAPYVMELVTGKRQLPNYKHLYRTADGVVPSSDSQKADVTVTEDGTTIRETDKYTEYTLDDGTTFRVPKKN